MIFVCPKCWSDYIVTDTENDKESGCRCEQKETSDETTGGEMR